MARGSRAQLTGERLSQLAEVAAQHFQIGPARAFLFLGRQHLGHGFWQRFVGQFMQVPTRKLLRGFQQRSATAERLPGFGVIARRRLQRHPGGFDRLEGLNISDTVGAAQFEHIQFALGEGSPHGAGVLLGLRVVHEHLEAPLAVGEVGDAETAASLVLDAVDFDEDGAAPDRLGPAVRMTANSVGLDFHERKLLGKC